MNLKKRVVLTTVVIYCIVLCVTAYKLAFEPFIFDPKFGTHSLYGFAHSDRENVFSVYYVKRGTEFSHASGNYELSDQTLHLEGKNETTVEWTFNLDKYLSTLRRVEGKLEEAALLVSQPNPLSSMNQTRIKIHLDDFLFVDTFLSVELLGNYTWNVTTTRNIPGSNYAYPQDFAVIMIPLDRITSDQYINESAHFRITLDENVYWNIDYVAVKLFNDYKMLDFPWWRQNIGWLFSIYISVATILLTIILGKYRRFLKKITLLNMVDIVRKRIYLLLLLCILLRLVLAPFMSSGDLDKYRQVSIITYFYGLDTRTFLSLYGSVWHLVLSAFYPIYLFSSTVLGASTYLENLVLKLPVIISDIFISFLLYRIGNRFTDKKRASILSMFWLLNPYAVYMSSIWGIHHVLPTMFIVFALERLVYGHVKSSALALSAGVFSAIYPIFVLPCFLIPLFKSSKRVKSLQFINFFFLGCSILALPWLFSIAIPLNISFGAGRVGFASLSYSYLTIPSWLSGYWSIALLLISFVFLSVYINRKSRTQLDSLQINQYILLSFLLFYLANTLVFPTYVLWSLPFLMIMYICARKVPFSYVALFLTLPLLWFLYWTSLGWLFRGGEIFRDTLGLNFSILCLLIMMRLLFHASKPKNSTQKLFETLDLDKLTQIILTIACTLIVFAPWFQLSHWLNLWNSILRPVFFAFSAGLAIIGIIQRTKKLVYKRKLCDLLRSIHTYKKAQCMAIALLAILLLYNIIVLVLNQFSLLFNSLPILQSPDDSYFSLILILWLLITLYDVLITPQSTSMITWIAILQVDYLITRHYNTYEILNTVTFALDLFILTSVLALLFLMIFYRSKKQRVGKT